MLNADRIVAVTRTDLLTLYGVVLKQDSNNSGLAKLSADTVDGNFQVKTNSATLLCDQPVKTLDFDSTASSVSAGTVYFVADFDFVGFSIDGTAVTPTGSVSADASTLYKAVLATGAITVSKVGL